jgi:hypothetical protein
VRAVKVAASKRQARVTMLKPTLSYVFQVLVHVRAHVQVQMQVRVQAQEQAQV